MLFDEIMQSRKLEDPEIRKAEDIVRSEVKVKSKKGRKTSVSVGTFRSTMLAVGVILSIAVIGGLAFLAWKAIELYIGG